MSHNVTFTREPADRHAHRTTLFSKRHHPSPTSKNLSPILLRVHSSPLNHIFARDTRIILPWGHFSSVIVMFSGGQIASVTGLSSAFDGAKRNAFSKISNSQNVPKHDTTTTLPSPPKKTRRPVAELPPKPMFVPEPAPAPAFDVRSIVPQVKSVKTIAQLREASSSSKKKKLSVDGPLLCIDGEIRPFDCTPLHHRPAVSGAFPVTGSIGDVGPTKSREQFTAFGIEAFPTTAIRNDICADFVRPQKWCIHGAKCHRIHPLNKQMYLNHVMSSRPNRAKETGSEGSTAEPLIRDPTELSTTVALPISVDPVTPPPTHPPPPPPPSSTTSTEIQLIPPKPYSEYTPIKFTPDIAGWSGRRIVPASLRTHYPSSDTSSEHDDHAPRRRPRRVPRASFPDDDIRAWQSYGPLEGWSDSDDTVEDEVPLIIQAPRLSSQTVALSSTGPTSSVLSSQKGSEPMPNSRKTELCRLFLQKRCAYGDSCRFLHASANEKLATEQKPNCMEQPRQTPPEPQTAEQSTTPASHTFSMTLHDHMRVTFGTGFCIEGLVTGFESQWVFIGGLPEEISDAKVQWLLHPFGEVHQVRRLTVPTYQGFNAQFAKAADAYQAFSKLNGTKQYGNTVEIRMSTESNGAKTKDNVVRVEWEYKTRSVVVGYESEEHRQRALAKARTTLYQDAFAVRACPHTDTPSCGAYPLRFDDLPCDPTEEEMSAFGPCRGLVFMQKLLVGTALHQDSTAGIEQHFKRYQNTTLVNLEIQPTPYSKGKMRAWAEFKTAADAHQAAANLNGRKPPYTNHTKVSATHLYSISLSIAQYKFRGIEAAFREFAAKIGHFSHNNGQAYTVTKVDKVNSILVRLVGPDMTVLGRMKSDLDKITRGEILIQNSKIVWDRFFNFPPGALFLENLQQELCGLRIDRHFSARTIRLFGASYVRNVARDRILTKVAQLSAQRSHLIPLSPRVISALIREKFGELKQRLGFASETIFFDLWHKQMKVRADDQIIRIVSDFIDDVRKEVEELSDVISPANACPICLSEPSSPVNLPCGHSACKSCIQSYLLAATELKSFPLKCLGDDGKCKQLVPLSIGKSFLNAGDNHALLTAAFTSHIERHPEEFHYCPTPDCPQIYRTASSGCFIQCPSCLVKICAGCNKDAHEGLTCKEVNEGDQLFRDWLQKNAVKQCPSCKMAIEKIDGCNHIQCGMCKTHVCWECMETFKDSGETYGHMRDVHGGFGLGPVD
ncbi:hypothetical protein D9619_010835 [Psilocybe cf. subviscida]|uniref:RING-type E3 ubiquitin transferase n=1 Tax=Psilocybe cf. subviscida TaxID=2480587 RepID=A0A8H5B8P4_9AGAR|nr:hypothetical protein D9619_010835 [Psilocybe cf. subviscida]